VHEPGYLCREEMLEFIIYFGAHKAFRPFARVFPSPNVINYELKEGEICVTQK
jgi:hypothetical protein